MLKHAPGSPRRRSFQFDRPSEAELGRLVQQYENITGDRITSRRPNKRNLVAACYRVHGADVIPYIADVFAVRGTAQNLLGLIRSSVPRPTGAVPGPVDDEARSTRADSGERSSPAIAAVSSGIVDRTNDHDGPPCPIEHCRPNLIYCDQHYRFGSHPKRRYDRRPSNPEAARYFGNADRDSTTDAATTVGTGAR